MPTNHLGMFVPLKAFKEKGYFDLSFKNRADYLFVLKLIEDGYKPLSLGEKIDKSSKSDFPLLTCFKRSVLPIISFKFLKPKSAKISLTSFAMNVNKFTTFSGVPVNFFFKFSS